MRSGALRDRALYAFRCASPPSARAQCKRVSGSGVAQDRPRSQCMPAQAVPRACNAQRRAAHPHLVQLKPRGHAACFQSASARTEVEAWCPCKDSSWRCQSLTAQPVCSGLEPRKLRRVNSSGSLCVYPAAAGRRSAEVWNTFFLPAAAAAAATYYCHTNLILERSLGCGLCACTTASRIAAACCWGAACVEDDAQALLRECTAFGNIYHYGCALSGVALAHADTLLADHMTYTCG